MKTNIFSFFVAFFLLGNTMLPAQSRFFDEGVQFQQYRSDTISSPYKDTHLRLALSIGAEFPVDTFPNTLIEMNDWRYTVAEARKPDFQKQHTFDFDFDSLTIHIANADADIYIYFIDKSFNSAKETGRNMAKGIMPYFHWKDDANDNSLSIVYGVADSLLYTHTTTCLTVSGNYTDSTPTYSSFAFWDLRYVNYYAVVEVVGDTAKRAAINLMQDHCVFGPNLNGFTGEVLSPAQMDSVGDGFEYLYTFVQTMQAYVPSHMYKKRERMASLPYYAENAYEQMFGHAPASLAYNKPAKATVVSPVQPAGSDVQRVNVPNSQSTAVYKSKNGNFKITVYTSGDNATPGYGNFDMFGRSTKNVAGSVSIEWHSDRRR